MLDDGNSNIEEVELKEPSRHDNHHSIPQHSLWVEKYTPRFFTELLSDDVSSVFSILINSLVVEKLSHKELNLGPQDFTS